MISSLKNKKADISTDKQPQLSQKVNGEDRKRRATLVPEDRPNDAQSPYELQHKRLRTSSNTFSNRITYWTYHLRWPAKDFKETPVMPARKRARTSDIEDELLYDVPSTSSDQKCRDEKSITYSHPDYRDHLAANSSFVNDPDTGLTPQERKLFHKLMSLKQPTPSGTLFDERFFRQIMARIERQNETRVIRDIALLVTPSAEILTIRGAKKLLCLTESTNAGWDYSYPIVGPRPQPDYSVGFGRAAFSEKQLGKLDVVQSVRSYYRATSQLYFPFLSCEVKCGRGQLEFADNQNAHSMTIAVRALFMLYKRSNRQAELHRKMLAFSISHDNRYVGIFAHYPEIDGVEIKYYCHQLDGFYIAGDDGKRRWAAYQFTRNVYDTFMPTHLQRIKSGIDSLPETNVEPSQPTKILVTAKADPSSLEDLTITPPTTSGGLRASVQRNGRESAVARLTRTTHLQREIGDLKQVREKADPDMAQLMQIVEQHCEQQREETDQLKQTVEQLLKKLDEGKAQSTQILSSKLRKRVRKAPSQ